MPNFSPQNSSQEVRLVLDAHARLGEGAIWHPQEQRLYWVDIEGMALHVLEPNEGLRQTYPLGEKPGTVVPASTGGVLVALQSGVYHLDLASGRRTLFAHPAPSETVRYNDGKCDPSGRLWVGTMAHDVCPGAAALFCINPDKSSQLKLSDLTISNGIAWSLDGNTMYFIDSPTGGIQAFDFDAATGGISNGRFIVSIPAEMGAPDGMTLDEAGKLWVAMYGGGAVLRFCPDSGRLLRRLEVPAQNVTSCAFGGPHLATLYITTASEWLSEEELRRQPLSGGLFCAQPGVAGIAANLFKADQV